MLKSYESDDSFLSDFFHKALKSGIRDVSVMMAYDVETMESVCASVYPGNLTDRTVFRDFVETNHVQGGIIITDRGFQYGPAKQVFLDNPDLHFLIPLERGSKMIREYNILCTDRTLDNRPAVAGRKVRMHDGRFLYGYRDSDRAVSEEKAWLSNHRDYDPSELESRRKVFGSIVFVSDLDAPPEMIHAAYEERWEIEVLFGSTNVSSIQMRSGSNPINWSSVRSSLTSCR